MGSGSVTTLAVAKRSEVYAEVPTKFGQCLANQVIIFS